MRFQAVGSLSGCIRSSWSAKWTLKRQKSTSSQAESISAWWTVLLWPSIVAALIVSRQGPASSAAARRRTAARSWKGVAAQALRAARAASMASWKSRLEPTAYSASTSSWRWGERSDLLDSPLRRSPPIVIGRSAVTSLSWESRCWMELR